MRVNVVDRVGRDAGIREAQSHAGGRAHALGRRLRDVIRVSVGSVANHLRQNRRTPTPGHFELLKNQHPRALADHEAVAVLVERPAGALGCVVARRQRAHRHEAADARRRDRRLGPAANDCVLVAVPDHPHGLADRMPAGGTRASGRVVDTLGAVLDGDLARRQVGDELRNHERRDALQAAVEKEPVVFLDRRQSAEADSDDDTDALRIGLVDLQPRGGDRHVGRGHRVLDEEIHFLDLFPLDEVLGSEIANLTGDVRRKTRCVEARDRPYTRAPVHQRFPVLLDARTERCHEPQAGHRDPAPLFVAVVHEARCGWYGLDTYESTIGLATSKSIAISASGADRGLSMGKLDGKVTLITGGARGIGLAAAKRFVAEGSKVVLVDLDEEPLERAVAEVGKDRAVAVRADVTRPEDVEHYARSCVERAGGVDIYLANAGVEGAVKPIPEYPVEIFDRVIAVNVRGVWLGLKHVIPRMVARGGGSIVITSSVAGIHGYAGVSAYVTSKHAVVGLMRTAALECAPHKIRVNTVNPAPIETRMMRSLEDGFVPGQGEQAKQQILAGIPMGRYGTPEEVADLMLFLASDESRYLTGGASMVEGGRAATRRLTDSCALPAVDRQQHPRDELRLVGGEEQRRIGDVPPGAHLVAERHLRVASADHFLLGPPERPDVPFDRHRRVHQA